MHLYFYYYYYYYHHYVYMCVHRDSFIYACNLLGKGFVTGSADKEVKFWDFTVESGGVLGIVLARQLNMSQDVLCCRYSPTKSQVF
jgi:hypothetical protein